MDLLAQQFRVVAADELGAGRSPLRPARPGGRLADEVVQRAPALAAAGEGLHRVDHFHGAIAARIALAMPPRLGHTAPVTHPHAVNDVIWRFLTAHR